MSVITFSEPVSTKVYLPSCRNAIFARDSKLSTVTGLKNKRIILKLEHQINGKKRIRTGPKFAENAMTALQPA